MSTISSSTTSTTAFGVTADTTGALVIQTGATPTTAVTVDTSQNVGIGTASPSGKLHVAGGASNANFYLSNNSYSSYYYQNTGGSSGVSFPASQAYLWDSGGTERMRITSGGYLKASNNGTYNNVSGSNHEFYNSANAETLIVRNANASFSSEALIVSADRNTTNNSYYFLRLNVPGVANRLLIADSGSISTAGSVQLGDAGAPPTSGVGIKFPATQSASSDANTLDDYEEGTWTPTVTPSGGSLTSYTSSGTYTKIGRSVYVSFTFVITNAGTASGTATIGGFPFTNLLSSQQLGLTKEIVATGTAYIVVINFNASTGVIRTFTNGAITWTNTYEYNSSLTYVAT